MINSRELHHMAQRRTKIAFFLAALLVSIAAPTTGYCDVVFQIADQTVLSDGVLPTTGSFSILIEVTPSANGLGVLANPGDPVVSWDFQSLDVTNISGISSVTISTAEITEGSLFSEVPSGLSVVQDFSFGVTPLRVAGFTFGQTATLDNGDTLLNLNYSVPAGELGSFDLEFFGDIGMFDNVGLGREYENVRFASAATFTILSSAGIEGDYNSNGYVGGGDFLLWQRTLGQTGTGLAADGNGDNVIDQADLEVWQNNFGKTIPTPATSSIITVPEPDTLLLVGLATSLFLGRRRINNCIGTILFFSNEC